MTDPIVARLLAALEALERDTPHSKLCDTIRWGDARCDCDYDVRRRLAIAQRTERAIEIAADWFVGQVAEEWGGEPSALRKVATDAAVAAFASPGREREDT